jgi:peptidoglycan/LPS O-acetylase OafA/YrhL
VPEQEKPYERLYFLDNLRSFIILLVLVYHAAMAYMVNGPKWFYVIDTQNSFFFTIFVMVTDVFVMPMMFFIAGFFAIRSLTRKRQQAFWQDKIVRIVIPYFAGITLLAPAINYIYFLSRFSAPPGYFDYWANIFFGLARQHAHLWFLGVLTLFFLILSLAYHFYKPLGSVKDEPTLSSIRAIIGFGLVTSVAFFCVKQFVNDYSWVMVKSVIMFQPTRCVLYVLYFALGVYAHRQQWFTASGYIPRIKFWVPSAIVLGSIYPQYKIMFWAKREFLLVMIGNDLLYSFFCLTAVFALVALFHRWLNYTSKLLSKLAANSYGIYFIHQPIVMLLILAIRDYQLNVFLKYLVVSVSAIVLCYLLCEYILAKIPSFSYQDKSVHTR